MSKKTNKTVMDMISRIISKENTIPKKVDPFESICSDCGNVSHNCNCNSYPKCDCNKNNTQNNEIKVDALKTMIPIEKSNSPLQPIIDHYNNENKILKSRINDEIETKISEAHLLIEQIYNKNLENQILIQIQTKISEPQLKLFINDY